MMGQPQQKFRSIHVAGTNGKGSISHMLASILQSAGYKTGLHTSPHLRDYRERFRINGKMILKSEVIDFVRTWKKDFASLQPSFFEMSVALAFDHFARNQVDIAVVETGMGGRLDSTNILFPEVSVITNIGWDHMMFLGDTLEKIAIEKAGIIKLKVPVIVGEALPETRPVFVNAARQKQSALFFAAEEMTIEKIRENKAFGSYYKIYDQNVLMHRKLYCPLGGDYQAQNILIALKTVDILRNLGFGITKEQVLSGIARVKKQTGLKGRWQILARNPLTIADIGHNKNGIEMIVNQLNSTPHEHLHFVLGMVNDKDVEGILGLLPETATYYFCRPDVPRGFDAQLLAKKARQAGLKGDVFGSVSEALASARKNAGKNDLIFVGGSTFVVAGVV
mgnify:CR=1 FL=1